MNTLEIINFKNVLLDPFLKKFNSHFRTFVQLERDDKNLEIPTTIFDSVLSSLKEINYDGRISLNLFNEPLASKNIYTNITKIHKKLPNVTLSLNSNGDYIKNLDTLKKLEKSGLKEILITLHTPKDKKWNRS